MMRPLPLHASARPQQGIALIVVMVMLLLGTILALGSSRTNWLNEALVGNESDYQRAYAAAEALIADAETDIRGVLPGGATCLSTGFAGCRNPLLAVQPFFPTTFDEMFVVSAMFPVAAPPLPCSQGICIPTGIQGLGNDWWANNLAAMIPQGSAYGAHTGANPALAGNPLLTVTPNRGAWYWVEVFKYAQGSGVLNADEGLPVPGDDQPFFYRITAVVQGQKPGTRVVLRSIFIPRPKADVA